MLQHLWVAEGPALTFSLLSKVPTQDLVLKRTSQRGRRKQHPTQGVALAGDLPILVLLDSAPPPVPGKGLLPPSSDPCPKAKKQNTQNPNHHSRSCFKCTHTCRTESSSFVPSPVCPSIRQRLITYVLYAGAGLGVYMAQTAGASILKDLTLGWRPCP